MAVAVISIEFSFPIFFLDWKDFRALSYLYFEVYSICSTSILVLLQSFVLVQQCGYFGGNPVTAEEVVRQAVGKV